MFLSLTRGSHPTYVPHFYASTYNIIPPLNNDGHLLLGLWFHTSSLWLASHMYPETGHWGMLTQPACPIG